jgi:hypothetical protein
MRALAAVVAVAVGAVVVGAGASMPAKDVSLTITYWADEQEPAKLARWTLRCSPVGGTLPKRKRACAKLSKLTLGALHASRGMRFVPRSTGDRNGRS